MNVWTCVLLLLGFALLIKGADFLVDGCVSVAKMLRVPSLIIGLTIVAFGTSCPELSVSVTASMSNQNAMAYANVVGSNIFNLLVVVGVSAIVAPFCVKPSILKIEMPISLGLAVLLVLFTAGVFRGASAAVGQAEGVILILLFIVFVIYMVISALKSRTEAEEEDEVKKRPWWMALIFVVGGLAAIVWGGNLVVESASKIAAAFGMSENLIGLTIVALGTSLPELVTSVVAAKKGESDLALGNAVGSNIFNILMVLGVAAAISPVTVELEAVIDTIFLIAATAVVLVMACQKKHINRTEGFVMVLMYAAYMVYACIR